MAASAEQKLSSLLQQTTLDDHEEVLKASNTVLKKSKNELEPQHAKVVALLKLDRFEDALRAFEEGGDKLKERAPLERAYALYKTGNLEEAAAIASGSDGSRGMKHVEAQAVSSSLIPGRGLKTDISTPLDLPTRGFRTNSGFIQAAERAGSGRTQ